MKAIYTTHLIVWALVTLATLAPMAANAAYTMHGHTFATAAELSAYMQEYNRVYNELHGLSTPSTGITASTKTTTITSSRNTTAVKTASLEVTTSKPADIDMYNVHLAGKVYFKGSKAVKVWFEYGPNPNSLYYRSDSEVLEREGASRTFDIRVTGLNHHTTYYYRAVGINEKGSLSYGAMKSVKTLVDPWADEAMIRALTGWATSVDDDHAYMWAGIWLRDASYAKVWFEYGREEDELDRRTAPVYFTNKNDSTYFKLVPKLRANTAYYFRVVAEDPTGKRSYGEIGTFTTRYDIENEAPYVDTYGPTKVNGHSASVSALLDINDYEDGIAFMVYGESWDDVVNVANWYTTYKDIEERGDALQKVLIDKDLNGVIYTEQNLLYLDANTPYYVTFGIQYENADGNDVLIIGPAQGLTTQDVL